MSLFGADDAYSQMRSGFFSEKPASRPLFTGGGAFTQKAPETPLTLGQIQANSDLRNRQMSQRGKASLPAYAPNLGGNKVQVNSAPNMDAWRQRRSQVGQAKRDLLANQRSAMEKAMQKDDRTPAQRMFDIQQAQRKGRIWV